MIVRTFSQYYPSYHPKKGQPTFFVEKICTSFDQCVDTFHYWHLLQQWNPNLPEDILQNFYQSLSAEPFGSKGHTIRAGHHLKPGDWFSPRVWSGKPYNSKQIIIAPDIQVKKTWDFEVYNRHLGKSDLSFRFPNIPTVAKNDGLELVDFMHWFNKPMQGQIICWNDSIEY